MSAPETVDGQPEVSPRNQRPTPPGKTRETLTWLVSVAVVVGAIWVLNADSPWLRALEVPGRFFDYALRMSDGVLANPFAEPNQTYWLDSLARMFESVQIAWIGTVIGALLSFPIAFLAASNTAPRGVTAAARTFLIAVRSVPELVLVIVVMLPIFGVGPSAGALAGAMALGIHSIGTLGKLTSEAIESIDPGPIQAVQASGASQFQVLRAAIVPQMLPETVAFWLYRFEVNIRASAILGVVGAGGVGTILSRLLSQSTKDWERIGIVLVVVIVVTVAVDMVSAAVRRRIIHGSGKRTVEVA